MRNCTRICACEVDFRCVCDYTFETCAVCLEVSKSIVVGTWMLLPILFLDLIAAVIPIVLFVCDYDRSHCQSRCCGLCFSF